MRPEEGCEGEGARRKVLVLVGDELVWSSAFQYCLSISLEYCLSIALEAPASSSEALEDGEKALGLAGTFGTHMEKHSEILRL